MRYTTVRWISTVLIAAGLGAGGSNAASEHGESHGEGAAHLPGHTLGVFLGDTTEDRRDGFTLGLEYEYRLSERYGLGLTAEHISGDFDTNVLVAPIALHNGAWKVYAGPGIEDGEEGTEPLFRVGVEYGFHFGKLEVSPQVDVDFVESEHLLVIGVVLAVPLGR